MIEEIKDKLYRVGEKVGREKLFELSPVYLLSDHADNCKYLKYLLSNMCFELEEREILYSRSCIFLCLYPEYNIREAQAVLFDESGTFKISLEQWLYYISTRHHYEHGIILINIRNFKDITQEHLWWKQFFEDIRKYKRDFLFFISCEKVDTAEIFKLLGKAVFTVKYELDVFTLEDYFHWIIAQLEEYSVSLQSSGKKELKKLLLKYEHDIDHHILDLWLKSLIWSYLSNKNKDTFLPFDYLSEDLLIKTINTYIDHGNASKIGFM